MAHLGQSAYPIRMQNCTEIRRKRGGGKKKKKEEGKKKDRKKSTFVSKQESSWPWRKAGLSPVKSLSVGPLKTEGERVTGL